MKTLTLALVALSCVLLATAGRAEDPAPLRGQQLEDSAQKIKRLQQERLTALKDVAELTGHLARQGRASLEEACEARLAAFQAELELTERPADRLTLCQNVVGVLQQYEDLARAQKASARGTEANVLKVKARRLEAEIRLEQAKAELGEAGK